MRPYAATPALQDGNYYYAVVPRIQGGPEK